MNDLCLSTLAIEINGLNDQIEFHKGQAVIHAARCGVKLDLVNKELGRNKEKFAEWLKNNSHIRISNAYNFISLSIDYPYLLDGSVQMSGLPNISQAVALLSAPDELKTTVLGMIEDGEKITVAEINRMKKELAGLEKKNLEMEQDTEDLIRQLNEAEAFNLQTLNSQANHDAELNDLNIRYEGLQNSIVTAMAQAKIDGEFEAVHKKQVELEKLKFHIKEATQNLAATKDESEKIVAGMIFSSCSDNSLKIIRENLLEISRQCGAFELELKVDQVVASAEMLDAWKNISVLFRAGWDRVNSIADRLENL